MATARIASRPTPQAAGRIAAALFGCVGAFQVALVSGAPWGRAAWGGTHAGQLPPELRVGSAVSTVVYLFLAVVAATEWPAQPARRRILVAASCLMVVGSVMNLASRSVLERSLWTPVTVVLAVLLWRSSRTVSSMPASDAVGAVYR